MLYPHDTPGSPASATARRFARDSLLARFWRGLADWLPLAISVFVILLSWYGYRAMLEWRRSYEILAERRSQESADLLLKAIVRDMRAVHE